MSRSLLLAVGCFVVGIGLGVVSARWETGADARPLRAGVPGAPAVDAQGRAAPRVTLVNGETHDFGVMEQNASRSHVFVLRNDGGQTLRLTKGETTCKCTLFEIAKTTLEPGEATDVTLTWEAKTEGPEFTQSAEIGTNDPQRSALRLVVAGKVRHALRAERGELIFNQLTSNDEVTRTIRVFAYLRDDLQVEKHELRDAALSKYFQVEITPLTKETLAEEADAKSGVEVAVTIKPGLPLGKLSQAIRLHTNFPEQPPLEIPFNGQLLGDITLAGPQTNADTNTINLGTLEPGQGAKVSAFLLIKGPHRDATQLKIATVQPAFLKVELGSEVRDNPKFVRVPLTVELPTSAPPGNFLGVNENAIGTIDLETTHPTAPTLRLKVKFLVKE
jgi:hypothetical protein